MEVKSTLPNHILKDCDWGSGKPYPIITLRTVVSLRLGNVLLTQLQSLRLWLSEFLLTLWTVMGVKRTLPSHNLKDCDQGQEDLAQPELQKKKKKPLEM